MKTMKKALSVIMALVLAVTVALSVTSGTVTAASKPKLSKKKVVLTITNTKKRPAVTLKVKGVPKKVAKKAKWSTSNKSVVTVKKGKVTAKKAGKATITCKVKGRKYACKVTVKDKRKAAVNTASKNAPFVVTVTKASINMGPTSVNNIKVMYNGEDITQKASYKSSDPDVGYVQKPNIINVGKYLGTVRITISYNGMEKTVTLKKEQVIDEFVECKCGETFYSDDDYICPGPAECLCGTTKSALTVDYKCAVGKYNKHCTYYMTVKHEPGHDTFWTCPYVRYIDFVIEQ